MRRYRNWIPLTIAIVIGGVFLIWWNWRGDPLPAPEVVERIVATGQFGPTRQSVTFEVPLEQWAKIRAAMLPSQRDFNPAKWQGAGRLEITLRGGRAYHVDLYHTFQKVGAFSAGPTFESRVYYRGGNPEALAMEMAAAYSIATGQDHSKSIPEP